MSAKGKGPVKVTVIETQYVQTDTSNFKAVVQRLTGKDQVAVTAPERKPSTAEEKRRVAGQEDADAGEQEYFQKLLRALQGMDEV